MPAEVPVFDLAQLIGRALQLQPSSQDRAFCLTVPSLERSLRLDETLAEANVWDGAWLVLTETAAPAARAEATNSPAPPHDDPTRRPTSPVIGTRREP